MKFPSATRLRVLGKAPAAEILTVVEGLMERLKLTINVEKTRCCRVPEEPIEFLGYRIGRNYRPTDGPRLYRHAPESGTRPKHLPSHKRVDHAAAASVALS